MDSTTNQPSGSSSSSSDAAERSAALSALQAQILSTFDTLVQYSTTLQAEFGGEADPRMLAFTSDIAVHLPGSLNNLEDARQRILQNLSSSSVNLQVVLHSAASQTNDNEGQNALITGQRISHSVPPSPNASRSTSDTYLDGNGRPRAFPTTFFPAPSENTRHWTSAKGKGKAKAPAQGTDAPSADAEGANEDEDAEAVEQSLSAFGPPSDDYPAGSKTAKGKGKARAIDVERRDDEDTAGPSVANDGHAHPGSDLAHAAAGGTLHPSTGSDAPQAQASNVPQPPQIRPLRRADAFSGKSHPGVFWASEWGAPPSPTPPPPPPPPPPSPPQVPRASAQAPATGSTTIHTADGVPLRRSTRHMTSRANAAEEPVASSSRLPEEPARRTTKRRAREDADEDEDDDAAEASPKKKAKQTRAKKPRPAKRGSRK